MTTREEPRAPHAPDSALAPRPGPPQHPQTYSAELVPLTAEPSGAGFSWMGVGFFLGILDRAKALPTPRGGRPLLFPPSELPGARRAGPSQGHGPGAAFGGRAPRGPVGTEGAGGGLGRPPRLTLLVHSKPKGFPAGAAPQPGIPSDSTAVNRSLPLEGRRGARTTALSSYSRGKCAAATAAFQAGPRSRPREGLEGGGGAGKGEASPPHPGGCVFHTPTRLRPYYLADSQ